MLDATRVAVNKPMPYVGNVDDISTGDAVVKNDVEAPDDANVLALIIGTVAALAVVTMRELVRSAMVADEALPAVDVIPLCPVVIVAAGKDAAIEMLDEFEAVLNEVIS